MKHKIQKQGARSKKRFIVLLLTSCFLLLTFSFATTYPLTITDDLGRELTLQAEPKRIVSMMPSHTETVCALGACTKLVGVDDSSNYPAEVTGLPVVGNGFSPNIEQIVALEPDLVLVDETGDLAETLAQLGLSVYAGTPQTYEEVFDTFSLIGEMINRETAAALLNGQIRGQVDAIAALTANRAEPSVFYELDATPYSVGPNGFIGTLISKAGGNNIVEAGMGDFPQVDPEFIVAANPDIILLADAPFGESAETLAARPGWDGVAALQTNRVVALSSEQVDAINRPGPRIVEALRLFTDVFHPGLLD